jgi:multidrug resistance protein MdtO
MPARAERTDQNSSGFFGWLSYELAPKEGRAWSVARMATACSITVAIAMVFQIPEPTYMAYIVFLISRDERAATFVSAIGGLAAVTFAIIATLALSLVDLSEPALRLPAMAAMTFLGMYSVRVFALGPITYLAGFVIVLLQSVVDDVPSPEQLTRLTLWIWVVLFVPIVITLIFNILFAPSVGLLRSREFKRIVGELSAGMRAVRTQMPLGRFGERVVELLDKKAHEETKVPQRAAVNTVVLRHLLNLLVLLEAATPDILSLHGAAWAAKLDDIRARVDRPLPERDQNRAHDLSVDDRPTVLAIDSTLTSICHAFEEPEAISAKAPGERQLLVKDATTNPAHWQFALKTTFAVMIVYSLYTLLDWPGLRTSIVTCFFVALGSLGETVHKLTLRISGALIGGALAGLCIVFVLPHCTDIGQLCLLIAVVSAGAAWVATSSEQLAYAGLQIAFAFFLGVLQGYAPATDLTVLRDRVAGILLGNVVMTIVFSTLWPRSAATRVRAAVGQVLRALATLVESPANAAENRERAARGLVLAEHFRTLRGFELQLVPGHASVERIVASLRALAVLTGRIFVSTCPELSPGYRDADRHALGHWASEAASATESEIDWPTPPALAPGYSEAVHDVVGAAHQAAESAEISRSGRDRTTSDAV